MYLVTLDLSLPTRLARIARSVPRNLLPSFVAGGNGRLDDSLGMRLQGRLSWVQVEDH